MELVLATLVIPLMLALLGLGLAYVRLQERFTGSVQASVAYERARVNDLERRLATHTWQEYAALSQAVPTPLAQSTAVTDSFGREGRTDESFGQTEEEVLEAWLAANGTDLEAPTVG